MRLTHVNVTLPPGGEAAARAFYGGLLGLRELPKPEPLNSRGGLWYDAGGLDIHLTIEAPRFTEPDTFRHFGLECDDVDVLRVRLLAAGVKIDFGRPAPWKRFYIHDPFGNRIEIHEANVLRR